MSVRTDDVVMVDVDEEVQRSEATVGSVFTFNAAERALIKVAVGTMTSRQRAPLRI
jgi:hypothetical protein